MQQALCWPPEPVMVRYGSSLWFIIKLFVRPAFEYESCDRVALSEKHMLYWFLFLRDTWPWHFQPIPTLFCKFYLFSKRGLSIRPRTWPGNPKLIPLPPQTQVRCLEVSYVCLPGDHIEDLQRRWTWFIIMGCVHLHVLITQVMGCSFWYWQVRPLQTQESKPNYMHD